MNAVGADQNVAARGVHMGAAAVEEISGDATLVLRKRAEPAAGADRIAAEPFDHRLMNDALQAAAVDRELRHVVAGIQPALFVPHLLAVARQIEQLCGTDGDGIEPIEQADTGEFADRMWQSVDADAELADGVALFVQFAVDAARPQHQCRGQAPDTATDDNRLHRPTPLTTRRHTAAGKVACSLTPPQAALSPPP